MATENAWRATGIPARFFFGDGRAVICVPIMLFHLSFATIGFTFLVMLILWQLDRRGYSIPVALRILKIYIGTLGRFPVRIHKRPAFWIWRFERQ